jgi:fibronectin type 3 domain-containing protein
MRTRLLGLVAVFAAALLTPSAAFADVDSPILAAPVSPTASSPVTLNWSDVAAADGYRVFRADAGCVTNSTNITDLSAGDLPAGTTTFPDNSPAAGTHCYFVRAFTGLIESPDSNHVEVTYDNALPTVTLGGVASSTSVHGSLSLTAAAGDAGGSGLASVAFAYRLGSSGLFTPIGSLQTSGPFAVSFNTAPLPDGTYEIHALATDGAGNTFADTATSVLVDNALPTVALGGVASNANVRGTLPLTATAADAGSGVASVTFAYRLGSSGGFTTIGVPDTTGPSYSASFDSAGVADGTYEIQALATDAAGNTLADTVTNVLVDNTQPTVALGGVVGATNVRGTLPLTAVATDTGSGVDSVTFGYRLGSSGSYTTIGVPDTTGPSYGATFNTSGISDGYYQVQALATDLAGNTLSDSVTNVLIDNHLPTAPSPPTGLTPVAAAPTITFIGTSDPLSSGVASGVDHYDVYRDGLQVNAAPIVHAGAGPYTWSDVAGTSTNPASGTSTYFYRVLAVDKAGNASLQSGAKLIVLDPTASSAPGSVAAAATPTSQRPELSWAAPPAAPFTVDHYNVYRNSGGSPVGVVVAPGTTFLDTTLSLTPGVADGSYTYQIRAASAGDVTLGVTSGAVTVIYDTTAPTAPGGVAASAALDGSIGISWAAASDGAGSGIARYVVRRALSASAPATAADGDATCQGTATSCVDASALNAKVYSYAVFAVDRAGNTSVAGVSLPVTARDQLAPAAPKELAAIAGDASVELHWAAAAADDDVAGYVLVAKQGTGAPTSDTDGTRVCSAIVAGSTACTASGLTNGAPYTFGLFALDEALNLSQAAVVSAVPNGRVTDTKAPAAVKGLSAKVSGHKVTLTWKNPADKDFDHVVITVTARKPAARAASKRVYSGKGTRVTTKLAAGQRRWFVVIAYDAVGNASTQATVRAAVAAPSRFAPAPRAKVHGKVRLSWPLVKRAKYYNVQIYAGKKRILVSWPARRSLQLPRAKLKRGTKYTWYVWPGLGAKAKAHYGKLIGKNVFTFTG